MSIQLTDFFAAGGRVAYSAPGVAAFTAQRGFASITPNGVGDFSVATDEALDALACAPMATPLGATPVEISVEQIDDTHFRVRTLTNAGAAVDVPVALAFIRFDH